MSIDEELQFLEEIEDSEEPEFGLLPDYKAYDKQLNLIENPLDDNMKLKYSLSQFEKMIEYVELEITAHGRFLKPLLPHIVVEVKILFEYIPLKTYGQKREICKFII